MLLLIMGSPQSAASTEPLTVPDQASGSVALAGPVAVLLAQNRKVRAAEQVYLAAVEQIRVAGTLPDPLVESTLFQRPIETKIGPTEAQVMVGQKFPLWGKLRRTRRVAREEAEIAALNVQQAKIMVVFQMRTAWENYLKINTSLDILDGYREELAAFRSIALTQYATGSGITQHPILKLQIEISLIEIQINTFQSSLESVINQLQALFDGSFSPELFGGKRTSLLPPTATEFWLDTARKAHPRYEQAQRELQIAILQNEIAVRKNYPDLVAGLNYTSIGEGGDDAWGVKVGVNLPIWLGRNRARTRASLLRIRSREERVEEVWNQIERDVRSTEKELAEIEETYTLYAERLIQESAQMLASAFSAYETGKISFLDLLDSERMVVRVRLEFEAVEARRRIASAKLLKDMGLIQFDEERDHGK
ncbi:MAG: TolC family protein [Candidatus Marinimicrobia bacterium]|nr:TolC family protein [Candidatus Neomarinimicrobiota bacterium]